MEITKSELADIRRLIREAQVLNNKDISKCQKVLEKIIGLLDLIKKR